MKIAIALFFRAPLGGLQDNIHDTALKLRGNGHEVMVFCPAGPFQHMLGTNGIPVADLAAPFESRLTFDLVHAHPGASRVFGQKLARRLEIPLFITFHGRWIDGVETYHGDCARILAVSPAVRDHILASAPEAAPKLEVIPNGADLAQIVAAPRRKHSDGTIRVLVASRFDADKGPLVDTLMSVWCEQALRKLLDIRWDIAGDGTRCSELIASASQHFGQASPVTFHGWLGKKELHGLYEASDAAVAPGRSAIDAMARGMPVIPLGSEGCFGLATKDRLHEAAFSNFGGFGLPSSATPIQIVDDLMRLAEDNAFREDLGRASRNFIEARFDLSEHHERLETLYSEAISANSARR